MSQVELREGESVEVKSGAVTVVKVVNRSQGGGPSQSVVVLEVPDSGRNRPVSDVVDNVLGGV